LPALLLFRPLLERQISSLYTPREHLKGLPITYNNSKSLMPNRWEFQTGASDGSDKSRRIGNSLVIELFKQSFYYTISNQPKQERSKNSEEWRNEEKAEKENRTPKEVQQEQEVVSCAAPVFAAYSAAPFFIANSPRKQVVLPHNRFYYTEQDHDWL